MMNRWTKYGEHIHVGSLVIIIEKLTQHQKLDINLMKLADHENEVMLEDT